MYIRSDKPIAATSARSGVTPSVIQRFWRYVAKADETACWKWTGATDKDGYGRLTVRRNGGRTTIRAHRLSYQLSTGEIPAGYYVLHSCDNPPCCNPAHLRLGTQRDNGADMKARGRCKGNGYHRRVHPDEMVRAIREAVADGELQKDVAKRFEVSVSFVNALVVGRRRLEAGGPILSREAA